MDAYQAIITRKCVRSFTPEPVTDEQLNAILEAGVRAPSGMANEPWRFSIIRDRNVKAKIAALSKHEAVLLQADALICLFMDASVGYHTIKDANTIGACTENMLLAAHALGLGAVWIAEILKNKEQVTALCGVDADFGGDRRGFSAFAGETGRCRCRNGAGAACCGAGRGTRRR